MSACDIKPGDNSLTRAAIEILGSLGFSIATSLAKTALTSLIDDLFYSSRRGLSSTVEEYWENYYKTVGRQGDDLEYLIESAERRGISIVNGEASAFNTRTGAIELSLDAKKWEFFEEFLHSKVAGGWKSDEISNLTKQLKTIKNYKGHKVVKAPATAAEEIIVKDWLLNHGILVGVGPSEKTLLQNQIKQLQQYGTGRGY
jgi:hypothetical protein